MLDTALFGFVRHETVTIHWPIASTADQQDEFEAAEQFKSRISVRSTLRAAIVARHNV